MLQRTPQTSRSLQLTLDILTTSALTPLSQSRTQPILDCVHYRYWLPRSILLGSGTRMSLINLFWPTPRLWLFSFLSPIITFVIILLLPSVLTFVTLLIHRIRAARAARRDRAPEDIVHNLPWHIWTGNGWEKNDNAEHNHPVSASSVETDLEQGDLAKAPVVNNDDGPKLSTIEDASTSLHNKLLKNQPWFESQLECAICLSEFVKGDKIRVLPCHHIFHLHEVDEWLIQRKKLVRFVCTLFKSFYYQFSFPSVLYARQTSHNLEIHPPCLQSNNPIRFHPLDQLQQTERLNAHLFLIALRSLNDFYDFLDFTSFARIVNLILTLCIWLYTPPKKNLL